MIIRCWGARGSIPVSGIEYLKYGGDTTCIEIRTKDDDIMIIDAGSGIRRLGNRLIQENRYRYHMIFTHSHWDHILGFPFFKPIYLKETSIDILGCEETQGHLKTLISNTMAPPYFPIKFEDIHADIHFVGTCSESFSLDSVGVRTIPLSHPNGGMGYRFIEDGKSFVFLTDNELLFKHRGGRDVQEYVKFCGDADLLIHDAEYTTEEYRTRKTWGHSTYKDALELAMEAGVKQFVLFHHNQERIDTALDEIVTDCRNRIEQCSKNLECSAAFRGMEIRLE